HSSYDAFEVIRYNTIVQNTAATVGGGISVAAGSAPTIRDNIVWDNSAPTGGPGIFVEPGADPTITYCDVEGGWPGTGNIDQDPLFAAPLANDFSLQFGSPCIETGDPTDHPSGKDLPGSPRWLDGNLDRPMVVDMGAFEFDHVHLAVSGTPTPGGLLTLDTSGTPGLDVLMVLA